MELVSHVRIQHRDAVDRDDVSIPLNAIELTP